MIKVRKRGWTKPYLWTAESVMKDGSHKFLGVFVSKEDAKTYGKLWELGLEHTYKGFRDGKS